MAALKFAVERLLPIDARPNPAVLVKVKKDLFVAEPLQRRLDVIRYVYVARRMTNKNCRHPRTHQCVPQRS